MSVSSAQAREVIELLEGLGLRVILVGGLAVNQRGGIATDDVDILVTVKQFAQLQELIAREPRVRGFTLSDQVAHFFAKLKGAQFEIRVDALDPSAFSGNRPGDELFEFVWMSCSDQLEIGRAARPEFVWYTRLLVKKEHYRDRIAIDLENEAPIEWLDRAVEIAGRFGTEKLAKRRATEVLRLTGSFSGAAGG